MPPGQILAVHRNASNWLDLLYMEGAWEYSAGSGGGTVSVPEGAALQVVSAQAGGAGTIEIDGGDTINVPGGGAFDENVAGKLVGPFDIVFSATLDYYVSWTV